MPEITYKITLEGSLSNLDGQIRCFVADADGQRLPHGTLFLMKRNNAGRLCLYSCNNIDPVIIQDLKIRVNARGGIIFDQGGD